MAVVHMCVCCYETDANICTMHIQSTVIYFTAALKYADSSYRSCETQQALIEAGLTVRYQDILDILGKQDSLGTGLFRAKRGC